MYETNAGAGFGAFTWLLMLGMYLYFSYAMYKIAQKLGHDSPWWAWVPILNTIQLIQMACKPMYWFVFLLVPVVNIVCFAILWIEVAKRTGHSAWIGFCTLLPLVGFVTVGMMAFGSNTGQSPTPPTYQEPKQPANVG